MSDRPIHPPSTARARGQFGRFVAGFVRAFTNMIVRFYALAILLVVVWAGYAAVAFLVRSVFEPLTVPQQYCGWPTALSRGEFRPERGQEGGAAVPRAPVEHYHLADRGLPEDRHNGCTTSGCHNAIAHGKRKETRAFANMHATFLTCGMCHDASAGNPTAAMWVDTATGEPVDAPAMLRLIDCLAANAEKIQSAPAEVHPTVQDLLARVVQIARDPKLEYLQLQIDTSQPGSPMWRQAMSELARELPNHVRGEYGAKLTWRRSTDEFEQYQERLASLAGQYQAAPEGSGERNRLYAEIHRDILAKPSACRACHGGEPPRLDFQAVSYSAQQAAALRDSVIARQMQQIQEGRPFRLPSFLGGNDGR